MLLYRFPEALCVKLVQPFLVASKEIGGLGLSTTEAGFINGTVGVIGLLLGGIAGGVAIAKWGLKRMLNPSFGMKDGKEEDYREDSNITEGTPQIKEMISQAEE